MTSASKLLIVEVTNLFSGLLKITVSCNGPYTLQVTGSSPLDFTYQLLDVEDLERGTTRRVIGNPLRGKAIKAINSLPAQLFDYFCFSGKAGGRTFCKLGSKHAFVNPLVIRPQKSHSISKGCTIIFFGGGWGVKNSEINCFQRL